jgi:hypothetical protein
MSFEPLLIQKWIYETLKDDATLQTLIGGNFAPNYQVGVYSEIAPEKDPVTQAVPQYPYVVFSRSGSDITDEAATDGRGWIECKNKKSHHISRYGNPVAMIGMTFSVESKYRKGFPNKIVRGKIAGAVGATDWDDAACGVAFEEQPIKKAGTAKVSSNKKGVNVL